MKPLDNKKTHQLEINGFNRWDTEFNEKRYIKDKVWRARVLNPITGNLAQFIDKYAS